MSRGKKKSLKTLRLDKGFDGLVSAFSSSLDATFNGFA
jgi:hypothetical protein